MRKYELTYLVSDSVPESDLNKVTGKVAGIVEELGGKIAKEDIWGRRKLAYPIKKQDFATYVTIYLDLPAERAIEFEKDLRHIDGIVRQFMIVKDYGTEELTLSAQEIAETKDIEEVVGGQKSFEAVEGETSESRGLMAKRESQENSEESAEPAEEIEKEEPHFTSTSAEATADKKATLSADAAESEEPAVEETIEPEEVEVESETIEKEKPAKVEKKAPAEKKPASAKATADKKTSDEVERLSKLNEELDDILKDEL